MLYSYFSEQRCWSRMLTIHEVCLLRFKSYGWCWRFWYRPTNSHSLRKMNKQTDQATWTCVCETRMPPAATSQNMVKNLQVLHFDLPNPGTCDVSEVWGTHIWTYSPILVTVSSPKCQILHFVSGTELQTNRWTDKQTEDPISRFSRAGLSGRGIKSKNLQFRKITQSFYLELMIVLRTDSRVAKYTNSSPLSKYELYGLNIFREEQCILEWLNSWLGEQDIPGSNRVLPLGFQRLDTCISSSQWLILQINKFLEISPSTAFQAFAVTGKGKRSN